MYSLLITAIVDRRRSDASASAVEFPDRRDFFKRLIFDGIVPDPMPPLRFIMPRWLLRLDYLDINNVSLAWLCSQRFYDVLAGEAVPCRTYPVEVSLEETGQPAPNRYYLFIPDKIKDAIDRERSEFYDEPHIPDRQLTTLVLKPEVIALQHPLFEAGPSINLLVHDRVRARMRAEKLVGVAFAPLETVFHPWHGLDIVRLQRQLRRKPADTARWLELARFWGILHHPQQALEALDHALALAPEMAELWRQRGLNLAELKQDEQALAAYTRAMDLNAASRPGPDRPISAEDWAWQGRCAMLRRLGRYAEAVALAEEGVKQFPLAVISWYELGAAHLGLGNLEAALEAFEQAPLRGAGLRDEMVFEKKGEILCRLGRYTEALAVYEHALTFTPINLTMLRGRLEALRALDRQEEAEEAAAKVREIEEFAQRRLQYL